MKTKLKWKTGGVLALSLLLAGCGLMRKSEGNSSSEANGKHGESTKTTATAPTGDARQNLGNTMRKLKTAYPYRLTETLSGTMNSQAATPASTRVVDFAAPDRSHMKWTGGSGSDMEMITLGDKRYWYIDRKWTESAGRSAEERAKRGAEMERMLAEATKDVKFVGAETVNEVPCFAYTYSIEMNLSGKNYTGTGKAWVGAADGLPHKNDSEFKVGGYGWTSHIVYEYNVDVKIEKPSM